MKINEILKERGLSKSRLANLAQIPQNDLYQATNGKQSFFPAWRKRIAEALELPEDEIFPEYKKELNNSIQRKTQSDTRDFVKVYVTQEMKEKMDKCANNQLNQEDCQGCCCQICILQI